MRPVSPILEFGIPVAGYVDPFYTVTVPASFAWMATGTIPTHDPGGILLPAISPQPAAFPPERSPMNTCPKCHRESMAPPDHAGGPEICSSCGHVAQPMAAPPQEATVAAEPATSEATDPGELTGPLLDEREVGLLELYKSHKIVRAAKITAIHQAVAHLVLLMIDSRGKGVTLELPATWATRVQLEAGGYLVSYADGYLSFSPAKAFEEGYTKIGDAAPGVTNSKAPELLEDASGSTTEPQPPAVRGFMAGDIHVRVIDEPGLGGASHAYDLYVTLKPGEIPTKIRFQTGPLREVGFNGITNEALLAIVIDRLRSFQAGPYACPENAEALLLASGALDALEARTAARRQRGVEGTSTV